MECDAQKVPNQAKAKRNGVKTHEIKVSVNFNTERMINVDDKTASERVDSSS